MTRLCDNDNDEPWFAWVGVKRVVAQLWKYSHLIDEQSHLPRVCLGQRQEDSLSQAKAYGPLHRPIRTSPARSRCPLTEI